MTFSMRAESRGLEDYAAPLSLHKMEHLYLIHRPSRGAEGP